MFSIIIGAMLIVIVSLFIILYYIISEGLPAISVEFLTQFPRNLGTEGGIFPAIYGTILLIGGSILFAVPIGVCAGIYLSEYAKEGKITKIIRAGIDNLNGMPSIVFGLFAYVFFVLYFDFGRSMIAGQLALGLMVLPTIIKTTEESVKAVPFSFREGSLALGSTKWQSIMKLVLPAAIPGIITGIILSMGRVAGETAPILYTAVVFTRRYLPSGPFEPVMALTTHLYTLVSEVPGSHLQASGTALVLLGMVIFLYSIAIIIRNHYIKKMRY